MCKRYNKLPIDGEYYQAIEENPWVVYLAIENHSTNQWFPLYGIPGLYGLYMTNVTRLIDEKRMVPTTRERALELLNECRESVHSP